MASWQARLSRLPRRALQNHTSKINNITLHTRHWPVISLGHDSERHGQHMKPGDSLHSQFQLSSTSWMPQLSITGFIKAAPPMAGQKRKAVEAAEYDSDEIEVASPQVRRPLGSITPAQVQNKRTRVLDCVLINVDKRTTGQHAPAKSDISQTRPASTATAARPRTAGSRLKRSAPAAAYNESSDDELLSATEKAKSKPPAKKSFSIERPKNKKPARKSAADQESDFENDSENVESEDDSADESASGASASIMSADDISDEDKKAPKKKTNSKPLRADIVADAKKKTTGKGGSKGKTGTRKNMLNLMQREKGLAKGLDASLPPLNNIEDIFGSIVEKACGLGLKDAVKHLHARGLRVATMCSGTEGPLLSLEMIRKSLMRIIGLDLPIDHAFSVEIVPFKQAYIDRNFNGPLIFRDATELNEVVNDDVPMATTAYGGKVPVPKKVDMFIAGTSCVDYSRLNKENKSISDDGESGLTWKAALAFCKAFRPGIVLLENVRDAPWDDMLDDYKQIGYETAGVHVDSKNHYLPQTRQRGYMVCFDATAAREAGVHSPGTQWQSLMGKQRRLASSPVSSFLLPTEQLSIKSYARIDDETRREPDWDVCKERHVRYRQRKRLGNARPFTHWQESGTMKVPENASKSWYQKEVERVRDLMDCSFLRKALEMYDFRFKTRILDVTQNVDLNEDTAPFGVTGCITPRGQFYVSDAARVLTAEETIILQGLPLDRISFTTETQKEVQDLAGNAMSTPVIGTAIVSALIAGHKMFSQARETDAHDNQDEKNDTTMRSTHTKAMELMSGAEEPDVFALLDIARRTMRRCFCEGSADITKRDLQQCIDCAHTTCISCGGNPIHNYQYSQALSKGRTFPQTAEAEIRSQLPLQVDFEINGDVQGLLKDDPETSFFTEHLNLMQQTISGPFSLDSVRRTHCMTVTYQSSLQTGKLELVLNDHYAEWRMFVYPPRHLPGNHPLRQAFQQPIAKSRLSDSLFASTWRWRSPVRSKVEVLVKGHGENVPSWWARNEMPDFRDHAQPRFLTVECDEEDHSHLERSINGLYEYLPRCGTACDSLYKRIDDDPTKESLCLFLDPSSVGDPKNDRFVFSTDIERLEYDEVRDVIAHVQAPWRPWDHGISEHPVMIELDGEWSEPTEALSLRPVVAPLTICQPANFTAAVEKSHCREAIETMTCTRGDIRDDYLETTTRHRIDLNDSDIFVTNSWMFEALRRQLNANEWHVLPLTYTDLCDTCAPEKPKLRWRLCPDGESIEPYEDPKTATSYERAMKQRPAPIVVEADRDRDHPTEVLKIRLGVSITSMAHRAAARLPSTKANTSFAWKLRTNFNPGINFTFRPFKLKPIVGIQPFDHDLGMGVELFPNQRRSLAWMKGQESGEGREYVIEESDEARLPRLGWAAEMRAQTSVHVRGGICADHPGYGKTILSLALVRSQLLDPGPVKLLEELKIRQSNRAPGLIPTIATLVICPRTLIEQWVQEVKEKLGLEEGVEIVSIKSPSELWSKKIAQLREAKVIVVSSGVLGSEAYVERLAAFAALPGPATNKGRAFGKWFEHAITQVPEHVSIFFESGKSKLREFVKEKYTRNINSQEFKAIVPSRRLRGKDFDAAAKSKENLKPVKAAASPSLDTSTVGFPLLEMFYFNRVICDEFHQYESRMLTAIKALRTDKIWGLSGTPAIGDLYNVSKMADLLGVPLAIGTDSERVLKQKSIKEYQKEMTSFERFDSMRQMPSDSALSRKHELAQKFLDVSTTRNLTDFPLDFKERLVTVTLDIDHRAVYMEMAQQLNSVDMRKKKTSKSNTTTDREMRIYEALVASETSEEALSRTAAFFKRPGGTDNPQSGLNELLSCRSKEAAQCEAQIGTKIPEMEERHLVAFEQWRQACLNLDVLGDGEAVDAILRFCKNTDSKSKALAFVTKLKGSGKEDRGKELTTDLNILVNRLVLAKRSTRFVEAVRTIQDGATNNDVDVQCDNGSCKASSNDRDIGVSSFCGHVVCRSCFKHMHETADAECPASGCRAKVQSHHMLWRSKMGDLQSTRKSPYGAKIDAAVKLLKNIEKQGDQAVLFVQYDSQFGQISQALEENSVGAVVLDSADRASRHIDAFKNSDNKITVIVLNASDETAAGLNLQNANHVIFLSPLLRDQQYTYDATMAQAIGRVRRHGQQKQIHVYSIVALDTIDVDILEHRERRRSAITEHGTPEINAPTLPSQGYVIAESKPERTQLVRENGAFSLRPQSWLMCSGADRDEHELDKVRKSAGSDRIGREQRVKMKGRVLGWEDFSSLIKFSRAYTEDDD